MKLIEKTKRRPTAGDSIGLYEKQFYLILYQNKQKKVNFNHHRIFIFYFLKQIS